MEDSKKCFKCNTIKPFSEFYKHKGMADGYLNKCKECNKKDVKENRIQNIDYYLEYDRLRFNLPKRVEARKKYSQTESGKKVLRKAKDKYNKNNIIKRAAHILVGNAVRDGKIKKTSNCESCGKKSTIIHGHHDDYAYPLQVRWLCPQCHSSWHKENGEAFNGN